MAIISLQTAASALTALNTSMDVTANNLANVNTAGFKSSRTNFQDLLYIQRAQPGVDNAAGDQRPTGLFVGLGVKVSGTQLDLSPGPQVASGKPLDVSINGLGMFQVQVPDSVAPDQIAYTRNGQFSVNANGELVLTNDQGRRLVPTIPIPSNALSVSIEADGSVYTLSDGDTEPQLAGQIETAVFVNPSGLKPVGGNLYIPTDASGPAISGPPGEENRGELLAGTYEGSNVDPTRELIDLIKTQRAFEMNSNTIRAADQNLQTVASLRV